MKRLFLLLGLIVIFLSVWTAYAYRPTRPAAPIESTSEAAPPTEDDYQRALIASIKEKGPAWQAPTGEIPDLALVRMDGAETVSLRALIQQSSQPAALFLFYPSAEAIGGVSILRWFQTAGGALNPIFIDFGRDSEASAVFARRFAAPVPIYRLASSEDAGRLGVTDPATQLPVLMLLPNDASPPSLFGPPFMVDELLERLEEPSLLGPQGTGNLRSRLLAEAEVPPAKFVEHFLDLHRSDEYYRAAFLAVNNPRATRDPLFLFARATVALDGRQPEYQGFKAMLTPEKHTGHAAALARYLSAWERFNRGDYEASIPAYQAALAGGDLRSAAGHVWYWMARAYQRLDRHDEAEKAFQSALQSGFDNVHCRHFLAHSLEKRDDPAALEAYRQMLPLAPWEGELHWHIGKLLHAQGQFAAAAAAWQRGMAAAPGMDDNFMLAGRCLLWKMHDDAGAIVALKEAIRLTPNYTHDYYKRRRAEIWNNLGFAYLKTGDASRAVACMLEATNHDEEQPYVWANLGQAYEELGRPSQALWAYEEGMEKTPRSPRRSFMRQALERLKSGSPADAASGPAESESRPGGTGVDPLAPSDEDPPIRETP